MIESARKMNTGRTRHERGLLPTFPSVKPDTAFTASAAQQIQRRIELLCSFPIERLGHLLTQPAQDAEKKNRIWERENP
jgi:hypothetical protein